MLILVESDADVERAKDIFGLGCQYAVVFLREPDTKPSIKLLRQTRVTLIAWLSGQSSILACGETAARTLLDQNAVNINKLRGRDITVVDLPGSAVRVTYGIDKIREGYFHYKYWIRNDYQQLIAPRLERPLPMLPALNVCGVDTEYDKDGKLLTVGFGSRTGAMAIERPEGFRPIINRRLREMTHIVGHSVPGDIDQLLTNNFQVKEEWLQGKQIADSLLLARMHDENKPKGSYGLEPLACTELNCLPWKEATEKKLKEDPDAGHWTPEEREERCRLDAWSSREVASRYYAKLKAVGISNNLIEAIHRIEMTLHRVGLAGAKVDMEYLSKYLWDNSQKLGSAEGWLVNQAPSYGWDGKEPFRPSNDHDIRHLIFDILKIEPVNFTKGGLPAVDKISLKQCRDGYETLIDTLLVYNKHEKIATVYNDLASKIDDHGYLHFWHQQLGARTGRRSSGGDDVDSGNAQNWPVDARKMIISRWKDGMIGAFDYVSLEPVLYAWISGDDSLFDFFYNGRGYLDICKRVLGRDISKQDAIYRAIKNMSLGVFYNMQDKKMATNLWQILDFKFSEDWDEHLKQTGIHRQKILRLFPKLVDYIERQEHRLNRQGYIKAPDGFIRHLPHEGPKSKRFWSLKNQAINFPVQHLASMVTGCAMVDCEEHFLSSYNYKHSFHQYRLHDHEYSPPFPLLINEVHDELTWDMCPGSIKEDTNDILQIMAAPKSLTKLIPGFNIKLKVEATIKPRWGEK